LVLRDTRRSAKCLSPPVSHLFIRCFKRHGCLKDFDNEINALFHFTIGHKQTKIKARPVLNFVMSQLLSWLFVWLFVCIFFLNSFIRFKRGFYNSTRKHNFTVRILSLFKIQIKQIMSHSKLVFCCCVSCSLGFFLFYFILFYFILLYFTLFYFFHFIISFNLI
jgi:hypothetical protein